jgi:hypothetical protein
VRHIVIRPLSTEEAADEIAVPSGVSPYAYGGFEDGELRAVFGLAWDRGRSQLWFRMDRPSPRYVFLVMRWAKRLLRTAVQLGDNEVFVLRDAEFDTSERLLRLLEFEPFGVKDGKEMWIWRN